MGKLGSHHMTAAQVSTLKQKITDELNRRNGYGSVASKVSTVSSTYKVPVEGQKTYVNTGKALIDNFLEIEDYGDLQFVRENDPIPNSFCMNKLGAEVDRLKTEKITGETTATHSLPNHTNIDIEQSSCRGACTGLCVGSCSGKCNGCSGCSTGCSSCTGCSNGCSTSCYSTCTGNCSGSCSEGCQGCRGCASSCSGSCSGCSSCTGTRG